MPISALITPRQVVDFLNKVNDIDPKAVKELFSSRVDCNDELAKHPTVQVQQFNPQKSPQVGVMGILNGMFGRIESGEREGHGAFTMQINEDGVIVGFYLNPEAE